MRKRTLLGARDFALDSVQSRADRVVVAFSWADKRGRRHKWAQAVRLRSGMIVDMQDFASPARAVAWVRIRTVFA
jgi:hypothetical protein